MLRQVLAGVLAKSLDVKINKLDVEIAETRIDGAWAAFDPVFQIGGSLQDARIAQNVREIDQEVDRLLGEALARRWDRIEFRAERARLGELMAQHVALVRSEAGLPAMELPTVWTWNT